MSNGLLRCSSVKLSTTAPAASSFVGSQRLWRSFLYVPGDQEKKISKIAKLCDVNEVSPGIPDIVVLDCEDAVSAENKVCVILSIYFLLQYQLI